MSAPLTRQIMVRMPEEMYQALADSAEEHGRTLAQEVRWIIRGCSWLLVAGHQAASPRGVPTGQGR